MECYEGNDHAFGTFIKAQRGGKKKSKTEALFSHSHQTKSATE